MKDIKTKGNRGNRIVDESADLASKMKQGLVRSKDQFQNLPDDGQVTADEYAQDKIKYASEGAAQDAVHATKDTAKKTYDGSKKLVEQIKQKRRDGDSIKQTAKSTGKQSFKTMKKDIKTAGKSTHKGVKTAESSARTTIKTTEKAAKTAEKTLKASQKAAKASAKATKKSAEAAKKAAEATARTVKAVARATAVAVKAIVSGIRNLIVAIAAGGWVAVIIIIIITMIALIVGSCFGLFYSFGDSSDYTLQNAISEIHSEYLSELEKAKQSEEYDLVEMNYCSASWKEVLALYAVKTITDTNNAQEVATMDEYKFEILKSVFLDMHEIQKEVVEKAVNIYTETVDEHGNVITTATEESKRVLQITVKHSTVDEMQSKYGFDEKQKEQLQEMLSGNMLIQLDGILSCINAPDIVKTAQTQLGKDNVYGFLKWLGYDIPTEWSACFVSWGANECGYIEAGIMPKTISCQNGVNWFKERLLWHERTYMPKPGDIVYFNWSISEDSNLYDGVAEHVGIVEMTVDNKVFVIEGDSDGRCKEKTYCIGEHVIIGYATPLY